MKNFLAALCVAALLFNGVALAGGLPRGLVAQSRGVELASGKKMLQRALTGASWGKLAELVGKAKQFSAGLVVAGMLTCGMMACTKDEVANTLPKAESRVATLDYDRSATLDEIITSLEQVEGAQIGIIKSIDQHGTLTIETDDGTVYLKLSEGDVLINNSETPLKVTLTEELVNEGWIAEGSLIAVIPAIIFGGVMFIVAGTVTAFILNEFNVTDDLIGAEMTLWVGAASAGSLFGVLTGLGTYSALVWWL